MKCQWCEEEITEDEKKHVKIEGFHFECGLRAVAGSIAHLRKTCGCYVRHSTEGDPPGMSKRDAAKIATHYYFKNIAPPCDKKDEG